jgi:hypothetical protein
MEPRDMAKCGFFYYNEGDKVQCAFCLGILGQWEPGDDPKDEHLRHFPRCPFMLGLPVGNVPSSNNSDSPAEVLEHSHVPTSSFDLAGCRPVDVRPNAEPERGMLNC